MASDRVVSRRTPPAPIKTMETLRIREREMVSPTSAIVVAAASAADVASRAAAHSASLAAGAITPRTSAAAVAAHAAAGAAGVAKLAVAVVAGRKRRRASSSAAELRSLTRRVERDDARYSPHSGLLIAVGGGWAGDACERCGRDHETLDCSEAFDVAGRRVPEIETFDSDDEEF